MVTPIRAFALALVASCAAPARIEPVRTASVFGASYQTAVDVGHYSEAVAPTRAAAAPDAPVLDVRATLAAVPRDVARAVLGARQDGLFAYGVERAELERLLAELDERTSARLVAIEPFAVPCDGAGRAAQVYPATYVQGWRIDREGAEPEPDEGALELGYALELDSQSDGEDLELEVALQHAARRRPWPVEHVRLPDGEARAVDVPLAMVRRVSTTARLPRSGGALILGGLDVPDRDEWIVAFIRIDR